MFVKRFMVMTSEATNKDTMQHSLDPTALLLNLFSTLCFSVTVARTTVTHQTTHKPAVTREPHEGDRFDFHYNRGSLEHLLIAHFQNGGACYCLPLTADDVKQIQTNDGLQQMELCFSVVVARTTVPAVTKEPHEYHRLDFHYSRHSLEHLLIAHFEHGPCYCLPLTDDDVNQIQNDDGLQQMEDHIGDLWAENTLNRAVTVGQHVYERAVARRVEWPEMKPASSCNSLVETPSYTSVDDAFSSILHFMSQTSKECKRYYTTNQGKLNTSDCTHCNRFHTAQYNRVQRKDPFLKSEDVHVFVRPGTYSVTARSRDQSFVRKHVVNLKPGQSVSLDFCL